MSVEAPDEVRTERLVIRPVEAADAAAFLSWRSRPEVMKFMYQAPWTAEVAEQKLAAWSATRSFEKDGDAIQFAVAFIAEPERLLGELMLKRAAGERQAEIAERAFLANGFFILAGDRQVVDLEEVVDLTADPNLVFIKLVALVGG